MTPSFPQEEEEGEAEEERKEESHIKMKPDILRFEYSVTTWNLTRL